MKGLTFFIKSEGVFKVFFEIENNLSVSKDAWHW